MAYRLGERNDVAPAAYKVPEEDFYTLEFTTYDDPIRSEYKDKRTGEYPWRMKLTFTIREDEEFDGEEVTKYVDVEINALDKGSIYHVLLALNPDEEPEGGENLDDFLGGRCRGLIVHKQKPSRNNPSQMVTFANVGDVKPLRRKKKSVAEESPAPPPEGAKAVRGSKKSAFDVDDESEAA